MTMQSPSDGLEPLCRFSRHGLQRLLERTARDPSWLADVVEQKQFARLQFGLPTRRKYVLIYDVLEEVYLVAILTAKETRVITILTAAQYENVHGHIAPVIYQLAKLARTQEPPAPVVKIEKPVPAPMPEGTLDEKGSPEENAVWEVYFRFLQKDKPPREVMRSLPNTARRSWVMEAFKAQLAAGVHLALPLGYEGQARLLGQSPKFHAWILRTVVRKRESLTGLKSVSVKPKFKGAVKQDITSVIAEHLA